MHWTSIYLKENIESCFYVTVAHSFTWFCSSEKVSEKIRRFSIHFEMFLKSICIASSTAREILLPTVNYSINLKFYAM